MKRILSTLTLLLCFAFTAVNAQVITAERAAEIANSFFSAGVQKSAAARGVVSSPSLTSSFDSNDVTETASAEPTFYVLTNPEGGFVIVSGEETENPIIGYSLDGTIDVNNLPDGFVGYMTDIDAQVKSLREYNTNNPQKAAAARSAMQRAASYEYNATSMGNIVKNLNTAPWGQRTPFNKLCPVVGTGNAVTGCVPTAYSILCRYYEWPEQGVGTVYNPSTGDPLQLGHTYDYASMRNDNYPSGYTDAEATAVATLMRDMGYAYTASYGSGTTTTSSENPSNLIKYFGFKCETPLDHGNGCTKYDIVNNMEQWVTYIKNCLNAGYPIPYSSTTALDAQDRHIYILDGYTDNNYFHFNWGWFGSGNGWFTLDNMVPDDYSNYSKSHRAYFNVIPDKTTYTVEATVNDSNMGTVSINGGTAGSSATANLFSGATATLTAHPAQGYALANWTKNGVVVGSRNTIEVTVGTDANDYVANFDDEANVIVVQDYTINATSGTELTGTKVQEWAFNTNNDYPAALKLISTAASINASNGAIQLFLMDKTSETYTLSVKEDYEITQYTIRCKVPSTSYNIKIVAEGQEITPTTSYADYKFVRSNTLARTTSNSASFTVTGNSGRHMQVESITVTVAKEGANVPSTQTTYTIKVNAETGGNAYVNGTNTSVTVDAGTDVTLLAYPDGTNYTFAGWYNGNSLVSSNNPYAFALNSNVTYTAKFNAVATTCTVTTTANPAAGGTAKFAVGTGSQKIQGDVENGTQITLYAVANTGYNFVNYTLGGNVVGTAATCNVTVSQTANYVANFEAVQQGGSSSTNLAGKYFRLKQKNTTNYMNIANNTEHSGGTAGGVNVTAKNENYGGQIFQFIESGTGYKLLSKTGYYIKCQPWNVDAISVGTVLSFETAGADNEYFIKWDNTNMDNGKERDDYFKVENGYVYCDAAQSVAATWVLEEVVYYTVTATAGEGGSVSPLTSTVEQGKPVTLTATANSGYRFVNWTLNGNVVSTDASYTFNATAAGEYVANFEINTYTISATANPGTAGSVTINGEAVSSKNVNENSTVTLVATPQAGYCFVNWTKGGVEVSTVANYEFNITAATELTANFAKNSYTVSVTAGEGGSATASATTVEHGGEVTLTADENDGYDFAGWYNGEEFVSAEATYTVTNVTSDINYTARFEEETGETPTIHAIHIVTVDTNGNPLTNNATGPVKAVINIGGRDWVTDEDFDNGATVDLVATSDFNQSAYLFDGWYKNGVFVSMKSEITVTVTETATYQARFIKGYVVTLASDNKSWGYPNMITYPDGSPVVGAATELKAVVKPNEEVLISINPNYGFRVANWTDKDGKEVAGKNANSFTLKITGDNKYTAHIEKATYTLFVSTQQGTMGEVSAKFMENSGTSVVVGHNQPATITASPYTGYRFVEWTTTDGTHVSYEKTHPVLAIENVEDMVDVEYVAVFEEIGTYYRIAYDFPAPVAAKSAATRAVGDITYTLTPKDGGMISGGKTSEWISPETNSLVIKMISTTTDGAAIEGIQRYSDAVFKLMTSVTSPITSIKYTLSAPDGYVISNYSFQYNQRFANNITFRYDDKEVNITDNTVYDLSVEPNEQTAEFILTSSTFNQNEYLLDKNFTVTIQPVGGETPETVKYYMQSVACGVSGGNNLQNALKMTQETDAASIFYYTSNKLMSYATGTYVNENGGTRGLQNVGVEGGDVTFESNKIKFTNGTNEAYLHAVINQNGTSYVDHCGSNPDNHAANHNFIIEEVTSLPVTITDAGYATWYAPVAVQLPDGLTAYTITIHGDYAITGDGFKQVPANTGVILEGTKGTTYELEIIGSASEVESIMKGTVAAEVLPNESAYVLSTDKGTKELGFYMADDGEASWSHKAYLPKSAIPADAQMSAGFRLILPGTTAVENVEMRNEKEEIYDLTGRKLEGISGTGIYIINGKKVLIK